MWELSELKGAGKSRPIADIAVSERFGHNRLAIAGEAAAMTTTLDSQ